MIPDAGTGLAKLGDAPFDYWAAYRTTYDRVLLPACVQDFRSRALKVTRLLGCVRGRAVPTKNPRSAEDNSKQTRPWSDPGSQYFRACPFNIFWGGR